MSHTLSSQSLTVFFLLIGFSIGGICRQLNKKFKIPYTPLLFIIGILLGYYKQAFGTFGASIQQISNINPRGVLMIFLPPLIFQSGFNSDWHIFRKQSKQIFILAFPSVVVSACLLMFSLKVILNYDDSYYTWVGAFMFGSILSCTDTVAVLALLKEVGAPKKFNSLIEGQSLLNDGTCMVLFTISAELVQGNPLNIKNIVVLFLTLTIGGTLLGLLFGMLAAQMINRVRNDPVLTLNISFASCFVLYFIAEYVNIGVKVSGIMALVAMGLYMAAFGKTRISAQAKQTVHSFWKYLIYVAQTTIFLIAGILVGVKVISKQTQLIIIEDFYKLIGLYFCMMFARFLSIAVFMPKLQSSGYGLTWKQVYVLSYGGLRGAVGIAFSLIVASNEAFPQKFRTIVLFDMAGCAFLTLIINAPTAGFFIKKLGLCVRSSVRQNIFLNFMEYIKIDLQNRIQGLQKNKYLASAVWENVEELSGINDIQESIDQYKDKFIKKNQIKQLKNIKSGVQRSVSILSSLSNQSFDIQLIMQCRNRYLVALKGLYWQKFQNHQCSSQSVILLTEAVDWDLDTLHQPMNSWDYLESHLQNPLFIAICFRLKSFPIIGNQAFLSLFNKISFIYDVISTYVQVLQECQNESLMMHMDKQIIQQIIKQSTDNRELANEYLDYYIKISFPQITKKIQLIKASQTILTHQKIMLYTHFHHGQIDDKEYTEIKNILDHHIMKLDDVGNKWQYKEKTAMQYLKQNEFFNLLDESQRLKLIHNKVQFFYERDEFIIKQDEKARFFFLITRGQVMQETSKMGKTYKKKVKVNQLVGAYNVIEKNLRYFTSASTNSITCVIGFPISEIIQLVKSNIHLQSYLYKYCLPLICSLTNQFQLFHGFSQQKWEDIKKKITYQKLKPMKFIDHKYIEIILKGSVKYNEVDYEAPCLLTGAKEGKIIAKTKVRLIFIQQKSIYQKPLQRPDQSRRQDNTSFNRQTMRTTTNYFIPSSQIRNPNANFFNRIQQKHN